MDWERQCWYYLTTSAYAFPTRPTPEDRKAYSDQYLNLSKTLPCKHCRKHWAQLMIDNPPDTRSRRTLTRWLHARHNDVNEHVRSQPPLRGVNGKRPWAQTHSTNPTLKEIDNQFRVKKSSKSKSVKTKQAGKSVKPAK